MNETTDRAVSMLLLSMKFDGWMPVWNQQCDGSCEYCRPETGTPRPNLDHRCSACLKYSWGICLGPHRRNQWKAN